MQKIVNRIVELTEFLEYSENRQKIYVENLSTFMKFGISEQVDRTKKDVFFNQKAQYRIKKALKRETIKLYELLND